MYSLAHMHMYRYLYVHSRLCILAQVIVCACIFMCVYLYQMSACLCLVKGCVYMCVCYDVGMPCVPVYECAKHFYSYMLCSAMNCNICIHTCMLISVFRSFQYMCPPEFPHVEAQWESHPRGTAKQPALTTSDVPTALWTPL